jgi:hypothetical protein
MQAPTVPVEPALPWALAAAEVEEEAKQSEVRGLPLVDVTLPQDTEAQKSKTLRAEVLWTIHAENSEADVDEPKDADQEPKPATSTRKVEGVTIARRHTWWAWGPL